MFGLFEVGYQGLSLGNVLMFGVAGLLFYLGIAKKMEPNLLVPIGFGILLVNLPLAGIMEYTAEGLPALGGVEDVASGKMGILNLLYRYGLLSELLPLFIFLGVGAMTDFEPTISRPISFVFGATAQAGVFVVFLLAVLTGLFDIRESACVAIIGGSDGPPTVYLTAALAPRLLGPITLVAYSYMSLVPIIQPPVMRLLTTKKERAIYMKPPARKVSKLELVLFPIVIFVVSTLLVPKSAPLIGMFMFGNLLRVNGLTGRLAQAAGGVFIDTLTFLLGISVGGLMPAQVFFDHRTLLIIGLAVVAFAFSTAGGLLAAKFVNLFLKEKINPLIGAAGVSAVPMAARVAQKMAQEANPKNIILMYAMGPNMAGAVATSVVAGVLMGMLM